MSVTAIRRKAESAVPLNSLGYPLRPGTAEVCQHFAQTVYCRYGSGCKYDHPEVYCGKRLEKIKARTEQSWDSTETRQKKQPVSRPQNNETTTASSTRNAETDGKATAADEDEDWTTVKRGKNTKKNAATTEAADIANETVTTNHTATTVFKFIGYNSRGFPLREGAEECQYYVNSLGYCKHGQACRHTHPEWVCEFAQDKPRATPAPSRPPPVEKYTAAGIKKKEPETAELLDREGMQNKLREMGLPRIACYYHFVQNNCRNKNCTWLHDVPDDISFDSYTRDESELSSYEGEESSDENELDAAQPTTFQEPEKPVTNIPKAAVEVKPPQTSTKSLMEQQAEEIIEKLKLSPSFVKIVIQAAKDCGANESLAEVPTSVLSQALIMTKMNQEHMRAILKEVAIIRSQKRA